MASEELGGEEMTLELNTNGLTLRHQAVEQKGDRHETSMILSNR